MQRPIRDEFAHPGTLLWEGGGGGARISPKFFDNLVAANSVCSTGFAYSVR